MSAVWPSRLIVSRKPSAVCQRVDEARSRVERRHLVRHRQHRADLGHPVLRVHPATGKRHGSPDERLRRRGDPGCDHHAGAFVADGKGLTDARRHRPHVGRGYGSGHDWGVGTARCDCAVEIREADEQPEVGRIDGRRLDAHENLIIREVRDGLVDQGHLELAVLGDERPKLLSAGRDV
jgi:hypothetical protein